VEQKCTRDDLEERDRGRTPGLALWGGGLQDNPMAKRGPSSSPAQKKKRINPEIYFFVGKKGGKGKGRGQRNG